jgi:hypothetical protein
VADLSKFKRKPYKRNDPANTMDSPPFWRVFCDGCGGQQSLGAPSYEGAVGAYLFVCSSTGSTDIRLYASHKQFPIALHQFLVRVQAEYWKCRVIFVDTHSVSISAAVEEVLALFQVQLMPISTSTPQELSFAESRVRVIKRMSTAMLAGAPHLGKRFWAAADKHAVMVGDLLPQSSRNNSCSFYMRTGRNVDWDLIQLKVFEAPALYSDPNGPIHKRAPITEKGFYIGCQWPAVLIKREKDGKIIMVSRQKVRVHESAYIKPLAFQTTVEEIGAVHKSVEPEESSEETVLQTNYGGISTDSEPEAETNMVQSVKSLQSHKQKLLGTSEGKMLDIEESAMYGNVDQMHEGIYTDSVIVSDEDKLALEIEEAVSHGASMKDALLKAIRKGSIKIVSKGGLAIEKNKKATGDVTSENIVESKRKKNKVVVREDWRKWVEAVKKELEAWDDNNAVETVDISTVPATAKIVPLGELCTRKRDDTYKYRQYLMGNLLRARVDYDNNFSTTISSTRITVFYAMATTSCKQVGGWDAVAGYLQTTEQFNLYAFLPTHADYSRLEYEEIAKLRTSFLKVFNAEGIQGIKKIARNFKK